MLKVQGNTTAFLLVLVASLCMLDGCGGSYQLHGTVLNDLKPAPNFTLTGYNGQTFRLSDQRGKVVLLFFGYTLCPDVCPTTLADIAAIKRKLGSDAAQVQVVFITIDPERDTQERLKRYVTTFDQTFIGLRGTQAELDPVIKAYGVTAIRHPMPNSAIGYVMDHSAYTYVIDQKGQWREIFSYGTNPDDITSDIRYLAQEGTL